MVPTTDLNDGNLNFAYADISICGSIEFQMKHPQNGPNKENCSTTFCKESYCQPDLRLPHHLNAKLYTCGLYGLHAEVTWVMFDGQREPQLKLECSSVYPGMTAGMCCTALSRGPITATFPFPYPFEQEDN